MTHIQPYLCHVVVLGEVLNVWFGCSVLKWSLALPDLASSAPHMLHDNVDISFTSSVTVLLPPPSAVVFSAALLLVLRPLAAALEPVMPTLVAVAKSCSRGGASGGGALSRNIFLYSPQLVSLWARLKKIFYRWRMRRYSILITVLRPKFSNAAKSGTLAPQEKVVAKQLPPLRVCLARAKYLQITTLYA